MLPLPRIGTHFDLTGLGRAMMAWAKQVAAGVIEPWTVRDVVSDTAAQPGEMLRVSCEVAPVTITLPPAATCRGRAVYLVRTAHAYPMLVKLAEGDSVNGVALSVPLDAGQERVVFTSDGYGWITPSDFGWDDESNGVLQGVGAAALAQEAYRDTPASLPFFQHNQRDSLTYLYQFKHVRRGGTAHVHLHAVPMAGTSGTAVFDVWWVWCGVRDTLPALSGWSTTRVSSYIQAASQYVQVPIPLVSTAKPATAKPSDGLVVHLAYSTAGTYTSNKDHGTPQANLALLYSDAHRQMSRGGSLEEYLY